MKKKIEVTESSGNVFADLNVSNPEEALAKAELASQIRNVIKSKNLTQEQAGKVLRLDQPKISALVNGKLMGFSLERLFRFLNELGQDITISVTPKNFKNKRGFINVQIGPLNTEAVAKRG